jgi:hypothetical protein
MRQAVDLWDLVRARELASLGRHIRWQEGGEGIREGWVYFPDPDERDPTVAILPKGGEDDAGHVFIDTAADSLRAGDPLMPALSLVLGWVNEALEGDTSPRLLYDAERGRPALRVVPRCLLTAMWLQLAEAVAGDKEYRACKECGKWFELNGKQGDRRTLRREFCSDRCKFKEYRRRKERARQLRAEGKPVKQIAQELGTDVDTVKEWVARRKG